MVNLKQLYSQRDSRWSNVLLGFNTNPIYNLGGYGCLITCLSMIEGITPDQMNSKLKTINGFANGGYYVWGSFNKLFGIKEKVTTTPVKLADTQVKEIQAALDKGYPVMCGIDADPLDADYDMHFVLLVDYKNEEFTIADPWTGTLRPLKDYLFATKPTARNTIEQYIIYEVKNPENNQITTLQNQIINLQKLLDDTKNQVRELQKKELLENEDLRDIIEDIEKVIKK